MEAWETYFSAESSTSLEYADEAIKVKESGALSGYGVRAVKNGKLGFSYCVSEKDIELAKKRAASAAAFSAKPKAAFSFAAKSHYPKAKTYSNKTAALTEKELKEILGQIEEGISRFTKRSRIIVSAETTETRIENSEDLSAAGKATGFSSYCEALNGDGMGYAYYSGVEVLKDPIELGKRAGEMSKLMQKAKKPESEKQTVVFSTEAVNSMLDILLPSLSGDWKRRGMTKLKDKFGKKVLSEKITVVDDPLANAAAITTFDDEGVPSKVMPLFERGILKNFLYNREIAAMEGVKKQGSCTRNAFSLKPSIAPSNLVVSSGDYNSFEDEIREYLLIDSVHGVHTANTTSGDFSVEANIAFKVKNGYYSGTRGFLVAGNVFNVFSNIIGLEKKTKTFDNLISPAIACEGVQIIG
jgi:PmbA protein